MQYLVKDSILELKYVPGKGSWTYHIQIPNTKHIKGKWGDMKVSGSIDGYPIMNRNLAPIKGGDKLLSINGDIRKAINKTGGDQVTVTLFLVEKGDIIDRTKILEAFEDGDVLKQFLLLSKTSQNEILNRILSESSEEKQIKKINQYIKFFYI
jgi:hypothetical protein